MVEYRDIPGYPGYRIGDDGSVWSHWIQPGKKWRPDGWRNQGSGWRRLRPLKCPLDSAYSRKGYMSVSLTHEDVRKTISVHRLVLMAFVGPCPSGMEACHNDGDPSNNSLSNLRWDTHKNNMADCIKHGTRKKRKVA